MFFFAKRGLCFLSREETKRVADFWRLVHVRCRSFSQLQLVLRTGLFFFIFLFPQFEDNCSWVHIVDTLCSPPKLLHNCYVGFVEMKFLGIQCPNGNDMCEGMELEIAVPGHTNIKPPYERCPTSICPAWSRRGMIK